ncbi:hypothetical protein [Hymenobacter volaticus]|uniref:Uncharacterized protein n=1 Tax=Hymenobacter volaticus TaxID=2932254 RepID=A0ABY4G0T9_9BACT|nr:hypothetical protein [Hymenobacter volaticus]UOQ64470.1 hypothetical protein MUN86_12810 [Hymenobacter volaticus]
MRTIIQLLCWLGVVLLSACDARKASLNASPVGPPPPRSYAPILLRTGLVKPQHRRWLNFCDTTRLEHFQLGHTPSQVRGWLTDYEERQEKHWLLDPDSLLVATKEAIGAPPSLPLMGLSIRLPTTPAEIQSARAQALLLIKQLLQAGLLTPADYQILFPLAQAGGFFSRRQLLYNSYDILGVAHRLRQNTSLVPALQQLNLLPPNRARQLDQDLRAGRFHDPVELLNCLPHARVFHRSSYPAALPAYLEQLHREVAQLLPNMNFTDFRVEVVTPGELSYCINCSGDQDVVVRLRVDGHEYTHRSALEDIYANRSVYSEQFYWVFNQVLADRATPYRLVFVESEQDRYLHGNTNRFGLWRLNPSQAEALDTLGYSVLHTTAADGFTLLPTDTVAAALQAFEALGFLRHLSPAKRAAAKARLWQARLHERQEVLHYVPGSVGQYRGDPYYTSWSYARLLEVLRRLSGNLFRPMQVQDYAQRRDGYLRFSLHGRVYQTPLDQANESPDARLFQLVQRAMHEQRIPGKFYEVGSGLAQARGMVVSYVFLLPEQERTIRRKHLLTLTDPTLTKEEQYAQEEAEAALSQ